MDMNELEPPPLLDEKKAWPLSCIGAGLGALAVLLGLASPSNGEAILIVPIRVFLSTIGLLLAGSVLSMWYRKPQFWLLTAITCVACGFGFPLEWDTFRLVAFVLGGVSILGAIMIAVTRPWRFGIVSVLVLFHFIGIFSAVTNPSPSPFLTGQLWTMVWRPYLHFIYLNNAYQFYSPDPGPASQVWFCIKYEPRKDDPVMMEELQRSPDGEAIRDAGGDIVYKLMVNANDEPIGEPIMNAAGEPIFKPEKDSKGNPFKRPLYDADNNPRFLREARWVKIPSRERDFKDPLGQAYYRRLSLTEYVAHSTPITALPKDYRETLEKRRNSFAAIPLSPLFDLSYQCRVPDPNIRLFLLPAYVRRMAEENQRPDRKIASILVYVVMHSITDPDAFIGPLIDGQRIPKRLNEPTTLLPYFMGEFATDGDLLSKNDPMLYWLVPIFRNPAANPKEFINLPRHLTLAEYKKYFLDNVAIHAGSQHMEEKHQK